MARALSKLGFDASAVPRRARYFAFRGSKQERKRNPYPKRQLSVAARAAQHRDGSLLDLKRDSTEDIGRVLADAISENRKRDELPGGIWVNEPINSFQLFSTSLWNRRQGFAKLIKRKSYFQYAGNERP